MYVIHMENFWKEEIDAFIKEKTTDGAHDTPQDDDESVTYTEEELKRIKQSREQNLDDEKEYKKRTAEYQKWYKQRLKTVATRLLQEYKVAFKDTFKDTKKQRLQFPEEFVENDVFNNNTMEASIFRITTKGTKKSKQPADNASEDQTSMSEQPLPGSSSSVATDAKQSSSGLSSS